ncbi:MAG: bifunctional adenosylcobinamide kinase/adenosylcobinamide-phosphate guanylyltransferase [Anaerolineae bacterium]
MPNASRMALLLGGARSGKSTLAQQMALERGGRDVLFVATAQAFDEEMAARIAAHRAERPAGWCTVEAPTGVGRAVTAAWEAAAALGATPRVVLVDCLTILASNVILAQGEPYEADVCESAAAAEVEGLLEAVHACPATWILVSNEVGMGLVPPYPLGRVYRDVLGRVNQRMAAAADEVYLLVAGLPWKLKG